MKEKLDLIRISKSSILSKLALKGFSVNHILNYAVELEKSKNKSILPSLESAEKELELAEKMQISLITYNDDLYPEDLKQIKDFPLILYAKGNLNLLSKPKFAIVGARSATLESKTLAENFSKELCEFGFTIVSGFAFGVDTASCIGACKYGTIQVLGSGVNRIYPQENTKLYNEVLANSGLFLSELPPNFPVKPENFPLRNRIISGLSKGILLVQASKKNGSSGSLITAQIALNQEKDLFAIPGHPLDKRFEGGNNLIKNGNAIFTTSSQDIIDMIGYHVRSKPELFRFERNSSETVHEPLPKLEIRQDICQKIKAILGTNPIGIEIIAENIGEDVRDVQVAITEMELFDEVRKQAGGFSLNLL